MRLKTAAMASFLFPRPSTCLSCTRRLSSSFEPSFKYVNQHIRGKKKLAKVATVRVQLKQNVPGYGRRGAVIPVTTGVMRNIWLPKGMAQYVTDAQFKELGSKKMSALERDSTFRSSTVRKIEREIEAAKKEEEEAATPVPMPGQSIHDLPAAPEPEPEYEPEPQIELELMSPDRATAILEELLPPNLDFYRTTISIPNPKKKKISSSLSASSSRATEAAKEDKVKTNKIHGSVTTNDIATNLKAILAENEQGSLVTLAPGDISFVKELDEKDRVKELGVYEIEIRLAGASECVKRTVQVNAFVWSRISECGPARQGV